MVASKLAQQIVARQKFIEEVLGFVRLIVSERGHVLRREVHHWQTVTEIELKDFAGFSFYTYGLYSQFGGEMAKAKVWYRATESESHDSEPVLEVEWWDIKQCNVKRFDPSMGWQRSIRRLIKNKDKVLAAERKREKLAERKRGELARNAVELERAERRTQEEAKRLGLVA